jgi:death-on-curing protein
MDAPPDFLLLEDVLELHRVQLERWGGQEGVRDLRALESAIAQPQAAFDGALLHEDIFAMAAAYAFHIAEAQAFLDGNKRTGVDAALTFLALNGFRVEDPECALYDTMIEISAREMTKAQLASYSASSRPSDANEARHRRGRRVPEASRSPGSVRGVITRSLRSTAMNAPASTTAPRGPLTRRSSCAALG